MKGFRIQPKGRYIQPTDWQELYVLTDHWKSDLLFYQDDLRFLDKLLRKYFIWITQEENLEAVKTIGKTVLRDKEKCTLLLERVQEHLSHLANVMEEPFKNNSTEIRIKHESLEDAIAYFTKQVRENRKQVFSLTEKVLDSEHLGHLL